MEKLIQDLEQWRKFHGLSKRDMAKEMGVSQSHYSDIINKRRQVPLGARIRLYNQGMPAYLLLSKDSLIRQN